MHDPSRCWHKRMTRHFKVESLYQNQQRPYKTTVQLDELPVRTRVLASAAWQPSLNGRLTLQRTRLSFRTVERQRPGNFPSMSPTT